MSTIERAEVFVASPGRNLVTLRVTTSDGVTGLGDATLNGRELAALIPIAALCLALGVFPRPFFDTVRPEIEVVARIAGDARKRAEAPPAATAQGEEIQHAAATGEK